jgi:hypothetical protein
MTVLSLIALVLVAWLAFDSGRYDWADSRFCNRRWKWVVCALLIWPVTLVAYLIQRKRAPLKEQPAQ